MKRLSLAILAFVSVGLALFASATGTVKAQADYDIELLSHTINVLYNGYVLINDTATLTNFTGISPGTFFLGLPNKYGPHVLRCYAYSGSENLPVTLEVPLDNRVGFYGVRVDFPQGMPQAFSVISVLSNSLVTQNAGNSSLFALDFPSYPALTKTAAVCNASIVLPSGAQYLGGTVSAFSYDLSNLQEFTHAPANIQFMLPDSGIQIFDVASLVREIRVSEFGEIEVGDNYKITNKAGKDISSIQLMLPLNASDSTAEDQFGRTMSSPTLTNESKNRYLISLTMAVTSGQSARFAVKYSLPSTFISQEATDSLLLNVTFFQHEDYYINQASTVMVLPEGARIVFLESALAGFVQTMSRNVFQESITLRKTDVIATDTLHIELKYQYNPLWLSFRPTVWIWVLSVLACVAVSVAWRRPSAQAQIPAPTGIVRLRSEHLRSFADAYEEKRKIETEMESMEERVQKGRIPRRRYKVRKRMLETRLSTLDRNLEEYKVRIRAAGGQYLNLMRQLEVAETEIDEVEASVKSIEARYNRGEITLETYRKMLGDYERRKENAETKIDEILLTLRE